MHSPHRSRSHGLRRVVPCLAAVLCVAFLPGLRAAPATLRGVSPPFGASGTPGSWDFGVTDLTFKADLGEVWALDGHTSAVPIARRFRVADLTAAPQTVAITLPVDLASGRAMGIAEIPHGALRGKNLVLVDKNFVARWQDEADAQEAYFFLADDDGKVDESIVTSRAGGLPADAVITSIAFNPGRDEVAAYDVTSHSVFFLDATFTVTGAPVPLLGFPCFFVEPWQFEFGPIYASGVGVEYRGPDAILASSGFFNLFETRFVLEYDLSAGGAYSGRAVDLTGARGTGSGSDLAFLGIAAGEDGGADILAAVNFADDALYLFDLADGPQPAPVTITAAGTLDTGQYLIQWSLPAAAEIDSVRIFENGVEVASVPPTNGTYSSPIALVGKAFIEVATEIDGVVSDIRQTIQLENSGTPPLDGVQFTATQLGFEAPQAAARSRILGVAATPLPETPADFRLYVVAADSNRVSVLGHALNRLPDLVLDPPLTTSNVDSNPVGWGVAIVKLGGRDHLAVLDSDGPGGSDPPSAGFYALEGETPGKLALAIDAIDMTALSPQPFIFDWDADLDGNLIAGGQAGGQYVIVRIVFNGLTLRAVQSVPIPHGLLTTEPGGPVGIGVSVLPSGNILVGGADAFHKTYADALLVTPLTGIAETSARLVGYAQGLIVPGQFDLFGIGSPVGPEIGPPVLSGMDTAFFRTPGGGGVGVTYVPVPEAYLIANGSVVLRLPVDLLIHSTNDCSDPDLVAEQLVDAEVEVPSAGAHRTDVLSPSFSAAVVATDYYYYVLNESGVPVSLEVEVLLGGTTATTSSVLIGPRRYHRGALERRAERSMEVVVRNTGATASPIRIIAGAKAIGSSTPPVPFRRGDTSADGETSITDAIFALNWLFKGGDEPSCEDTADVDDNGTVNLTDPVYLLVYLFRSGEPPLPPGPDACGPDETADDLPPCAYSAELCQ